MNYDKMSQKNSVCIIGGGVAGLCAAVFLTKEKFDVSLIESKPRLGGRTYSFFDKTLNRYVDNGQHILASWYKNTFEYLKIIGSIDKLEFQDKLKIVFRDQHAKQFIFNCPKITPPFHLLWGIMRYKALKLEDKISLIRLIKLIRYDGYTETQLQNQSTSELFKNTKQTENLIKCFWEPFIIAVFNSKPEHVSALLFERMIKFGFIQNGNSNLVLPRVNLNKLFVEPALNYLKTNGANILTDTIISEMDFENNSVKKIAFKDNTEFKSDFYISAVPFFDFNKLVGDKIYNKYFSKLNELRSSPIVNIHLTFKNSLNGILKDNFYGVLGSTIQWVFKVDDKQICVVISDAKEISEKDKNIIEDLVRNELHNSFPELKNIKIIHCQIIKEMRATFLPDNNSMHIRPECKTKFHNFFLAGDWTDTGFPATIEGAAVSAMNCINNIKSITKIKN